MRNAVSVAVLLLAAGCSHTTSGQSRQTTSTAQSTSARAASPSAGTPSAAKPVPATAPAPGAAISDVIAWIEAAPPADPGHYHSATRAGVTTDLAGDIAFTTGNGKVACMTDAKHTGGALACLVDLAKPPPPPSTVYGEWQGGWVDFDGTSLQVGSAHGDPGPFSNGDGPQLPYGQSLSFTDFRCRADQLGLFCVNYAHQSAARLSAAGIQPFGCLQSAPPPEGVGEKFSC